MRNCRMAMVLAVMMFLWAGASAISSAQTNRPQASDDEQAIWHLEHAYWDYVQDNNLAAYRGLWHEDFLGWPSVSPSPLGKDHITDWITSQTAKGLAFKSIAFKPAKIQITGNLAMAYYWITCEWVDKDGKGDPRTLRITHTWLKAAGPRILSGGSLVECPCRNPLLRRTDHALTARKCRGRATRCYFS